MTNLKNYLEAKVNSRGNKNLKYLSSFFSETELSILSEKTISIVGTNGKTSTANFVYQLLCKETTKVLMFTSPHLVNFTERIQSNNEINFDYLARIVKEFESENNITLGYFETLTLIDKFYLFLMIFLVYRSFFEYDGPIP